VIADLKPYPEYKESGLPWLGKVPAHWNTKRAKWLFTKMDRPVRPDDATVTCFRDGVVTLRKNRRLRGFTEAIYELGYQGIRKGDLVIHAMDAFGWGNRRDYPADDRTSAPANGDAGVSADVE
jgi:type I restriction enzyme S subunit